MNVTSTARGFDPRIAEGYAAFKYAVDKYQYQLEFAALDFKELENEYGEPYQVVPVIRLSFK